jgi:hypothetical protein
MMKTLTSALGTAFLWAAILVVVVILLVRVNAGPSTSIAGSAASPGVGSTSSSSSIPSPVDSTAAVCGSEVRSFDQAAPTIANRAFASTAVSIAIVQAVLPARWNTSDGSAPTFDGDGHPPAWAEIYRPVMLSIESTSKGTLASTVTVQLPGGEVACYSSEVEGTPPLVVGSRWALFLGRSQTAAGFSTAQLAVVDAWQVDANGTINTPQNGIESIAEFTAAVSTAN